MGWEQKALRRLLDATYKATCVALKAWFDPKSCQTRYQSEFQTRHKKAGKEWADLADDLKFLAYKACPTLQEEASEGLSINAYLQYLTQPQLAFSLRQKRHSGYCGDSYPRDGVLSSQRGVSSVIQSKGESVSPEDATDKVAKLTRMVEQLAEQV